MSPYEIAYPGGSVEHWNEEPGSLWMQRVLNTFGKVAWLNPLPEKHWQYTQSVGMTKELIRNKMYPLSIKGLEDAMKHLVN